jgi:pentatricopeptide repeat protein
MLIDKMLYAYNNLQQFSNAIALWAAAKKFKQPVRRNSYTWALHAYAASHRHEEAEVLFQEIQALDIPCPRTSYLIMIPMYARLLLPNMAEELFNEMKEKGHPCSQKIYGTMIEMYGHLLQKEQALGMLKTMKKEGLAPTKQILIYVLRMLGRLKDPNFATTFTRFQKKYNLRVDAKIYDVLIQTYIHRRKPLAALKIYEKMRAHGIAPTSLVISRLLFALYDLGKHEKVTKLFEGHSEGLLREHAFAVAIFAYGQLDRMEDAEETFRRAKERGQADAFTYEALISVYIANGLTDHAHTCFMDLVEEGLRPSLALYNLVLLMYSRLGQLEKVEHVLNLLSEDVEDVLTKYKDGGHAILEGAPGFKRKLLQLDWLTNFYSFVLRLYERLNKPEEARKLLRRMEGRRIRPDYVAYNALVDLYNRLPAGREATLLYAQLRRVTPVRPSPLPPSKQLRSHERLNSMSSPDIMTHDLSKE